MNTKKYFQLIFFLGIMSVFSGCAEWDSDGVDFRNYIRDKHPYSELTEIDLNTFFSYLVNDTIRNEVWVYTSGRSEISVRRVCINCQEKKQ